MHPAQLRICHERIGTLPSDFRGRYRVRWPRFKRWRWCDLPAHAWCFEDSKYVCEIHLNANHSLHRTQLVSEE